MMKINVSENRYELPLETLMTLAKRLNNEKRNFLFVSKVLGKHLPINPDVCHVSGRLLASLIYGETKDTPQWIRTLQGASVSEASMQTIPYHSSERLLVMGFAETATGLGMAVAGAIAGAGANFVHTTRERVSDLNSCLRFEEEHSHATTHDCLLDDVSLLASAQHIVLVDDELTTGQSVMNMLAVLVKQTGAKKFSVLTLLDWRTAEQEAQLQALARRYGIEVNVLALIRGQAVSSDTHVYQNSGEIPNLLETITPHEQLNLGIIPRVTYQTQQGPTNYYAASGRFGVSANEIQRLEADFGSAARKMSEHLQPHVKTILVLGHGEDIYIPSRVASHLQRLSNCQVDFKTTTRSPIYCTSDSNYPFQMMSQFRDAADTVYYFYNQAEIEAHYDLVIFISEVPQAVRFVSKQLTVIL